MNNLINLLLAVSMSLTMAGAKAEDMKKEDMAAKQDHAQQADMAKQAMKKPARKHKTKKTGMAKGDMKPQEGAAREEMKK